MIKRLTLSCAGASSRRGVRLVDNETLDDLDEQISPQASLPEVKRVISILIQKFQRGDGKAGFMLGTLYEPDGLLISEAVKEKIGVSHEQASDYYSKAYHIIAKQAVEGDGPAMHLMAFYFQTGTPPVTRDHDKYEYWIKKCIEAGYRAGGQL
jgi:TPR repeat protein